MNVPAPDVEAMARELATLRAQLDEASALERYLRQRTWLLNNEIRNRDEMVAERDLSIASLTRQIADLASRTEPLEAAT